MGTYTEFKIDAPLRPKRSQRVNAILDAMLARDEEQMPDWTPVRWAWMFDDGSQLVNDRLTAHGEIKNYSREIEQLFQLLGYWITGPQGAEVGRFRCEYDDHWTIAVRQGRGVAFRAPPS